jgi:hypothetical protein
MEKFVYITVKDKPLYLLDECPLCKDTMMLREYRETGDKWILFCLSCERVVSKNRISIVQL